MAGQHEYTKNELIHIKQEILPDDDFWGLTETQKSIDPESLKSVFHAQLQGFIVLSLVKIIVIVRSLIIADRGNRSAVPEIACPMIRHTESHSHMKGELKFIERRSI